MADNTTLASASGGDTIRTDEVGGVKIPASKINLGADGVDDGFVSSANPLPVTATNLDVRDIDKASDDITIYANTAKDGSGTAYVPLVDTDGHQQVDVLSSALPTGAATAANQTTGNTALAAIQTAVEAIKTAVEILDNTVAGSELQVDVLTLPSITLAAGTNNIGDVDILSIAAGDNNIGNVDIVTQPARAATTDTITAKLATDAIQNGTTALTPKFVIIDCASSGDNTILAAVASKKIRVLSVFLVAAGTTTVRFESGAWGTALTGQMNLVANTGFVLPFNPIGWFETASNTLLNLELSAAVSVDGCLTYVEV